MWLLVAHLLASVNAAYEFDDFKQPTSAIACSSNPHDEPCDPDFATGNSICPIRTISNTYTWTPDDEAEQETTFFYWGYRSTKKVYTVYRSNINGDNPDIGIHYTLATIPTNLSTEPYFYVFFEYSIAAVSAGSLQITVNTIAGSATCSSVFPTAIKDIQTGIVCPVSTMIMNGMTAADLESTTSLDLSISMLGSGFLSMRAFGTATPTVTSIAQAKTISAGTTELLDFTMSLPVKGANLTTVVTPLVGSGLSATQGMILIPTKSSWSSFITVASATQPGSYKITVGYTPTAGNLNVFFPANTDFFITVNRLPITSVAIPAMLHVTPGVTNSSTFTFVTNNRAVNGAVRLTPTSSFFVFDPPFVLVSNGTTTSGSLRVHAREGTPVGLHGFSVIFSGETGNNNDLSSGSYTVPAVINVTQDALTTVTISSIVLEAGAAGQNAMLTANVRPVNGTITLTPISTWLTFSPSSISFRGTTTAGPFVVAALPGAPKGINTVQVLVTADAGNNNAIPQSLLAVAPGTVDVTQPPITTINQQQSLTNVTAGGNGVTITYVLQRPALNGSIIVNLVAPNLVFSPNPLIIAKDADSGSVVVTAESGAAPGVISVTATLSSGLNNNNAVTTSAISVAGLQVIQYLIDSAVITSSVSVAAGDDINQKSTTIRLPVPVVNGPVSLALSASPASKVSFHPASFTILPGSTDTISFEVKADSDAPAGLVAIIIGITQGSGNNNRLAQPSLVISNAVNVTLIPIDGLMANHESGSTQRNHNGTTTFTLTTLKVVNGAVTVTPVAQGITFFPASLDILPGEFQTEPFTYSVSSQAVGGPRSIQVSITGTTNNNELRSPYTAGTLTILDADIPVVISLSPSVQFVAGRVSASTHFHLGTLASNGSITITPSYTGLTFTPSSVLVTAEATDSDPFTVTVDSTVDLSLQPFSVALTLTKNDFNNNNLLSGYTVSLPVAGLPITTVTYNQAEANIYAGFSVANQRVTVDSPAIRQPVSLSLSSPFFDFVPSNVTIPVDSDTSDFFTMVAKPNAVPGANSFNVDFSQSPGNNNIIPSSTVVVVGVNVVQKPVTNLWVLNSVDVLIGNGPSAPTRFYLDEPAVNGSIKLTPSHPELIFVPNPIYVFPGSNVSENFTVTAPENMIAAPFGVAFPVLITKGDSDNNNALPDNNPAPSSNNGIYVRKPVFANIHLNESISVDVGNDWSSSVSLVFDVPMLNDSAVFTFIVPESSGIEFDPSSVTVAQGSTVSSPFKVKFQDFVAARVFPFSVNNTGGPYLNNDVSHVSNVLVSGLNASWAAISAGTIPSTTVYAGGNATDSITITLDEAPVYSDINLLLSGDNLVFSPATVKVLKGQYVSEPFNITADGAALKGDRYFTVDVENVGGVAHNTWTQLYVPLTVGQLRWSTLSYVTTPHVIAGSPLGTLVEVRADLPAINGVVIITCQSPPIQFCVPTITECESYSPAFVDGSSVSPPARIFVPRNYRPGVYTIKMSVVPLGANMAEFGNDEFLSLPGLVVEDGFGPLLNIAEIVPEMNFATVIVTSDEAGLVWCKAVLRGASEPSYSSGYTDHPADINFTAAGSQTFNLTGLASNTDYDLYCYGVDAIENKDTADEVIANKAVFKTTIDPEELNRMGPSTTGLAPASVAGIVIGAIIGVLLIILLAVGIKRWLNSRSDWTKNESLFLEAELAQKKKPAGEAASSAAPSSAAPGASPAPAPAAAVVSTSGKGTEGLPTL